MEAWAKEMLDVWSPRIPQIAEASMPAIERMWKGKYRVEEIAQMIHGGHAMMTEWLEGRTSDMRDDYLETIVPGLMAQGESASGIGAIDCAVILRIIATIIPEMKPEYRAQAMDAFIEWQSLFLQDLVLTGIKNGGRP